MPGDSYTWTCGHNENKDSSNKGNFLELLNLRAKNNNILKEYFLQKNIITDIPMAPTSMNLLI